MFTYFFSLAIIAFEVICCKIFFESFCDSSGENRKYKRTILLVLLIAIYYICGFTLSKWIVLKQLCAIMSTAIIMRFYFEISLVKSAVFAILYQGLLMLVDYLVYAGNSAIVSREGIVTQEYALEVQIPLHRITDSASNGSVFPVVTEHFSASSDHAFL